MAYNPSLHTSTNKPIAPNGVPTDARSYFYDVTSFTYRPYNSVAEVLSYLNTTNSRKGSFPIFIKVNGVLLEYWFKNDNTSDADLSSKTLDLAAKATLPDGLIQVGTVMIDPSTYIATISGFASNYQGAPSSLDIGTVQLASPDINYPKVQLIYYVSANKTYGSVAGTPHQSPILDVPILSADKLLIARVDTPALNVGNSTITYSVVTSYVDTITPSQSIKALKNFDGGLTASDRRVNVIGGINVTGAVAWEQNHTNAFLSQTSSIVDDTSNRLGKSIKVVSGITGGTGRQIYGPYSANLPGGDFEEGEYWYEVYVRIDNNTDPNYQYAIDVAENGIGVYTKTFKPTDIVGTGWNCFVLPFTKKLGVGVEFRLGIISGTSTANLYFYRGLVRHGALAKQIAGISTSTGGNATITTTDLVKSDINVQAAATSSAVNLTWTDGNASLGTSNKVVVIGSSTSQGTGASSTATSYVGLLSAWLGNTYKNQSLVNLAVGGYTTYQLMPTGFVPPSGRPSPEVNNNITKALSLNPNIIIINIPTNDTVNGYSVEDYMNNVSTIIHLAKEAGVKVFVTTTQPRNIDATGRGMLQVETTLLKGQYGVEVMDFQTPLANSDDTIKSELNSGDGIHVNDTGHALLFNVAKDTLKPYIDSTIKVVRKELEQFSFATNAWTSIQSNLDKLATTYSVGSLSNNTFYSFRVKTVGLYNSVYSPQVSLIYSGASTTNPTPIVSISPASASITSGQTATFTASSDIASSTFKWYTASTGGTLLASTASYTTPALTANTTYYAEATSPAGVVSSRLGVTATVTTSSVTSSGRYLFDLGFASSSSTGNANPAATSTPSSATSNAGQDTNTSLWWNNVTETAINASTFPANLFTSAVSTNNVSEANLKLRVDKSGIGTFASTNQINGNGATVAVGDYPLSATADSMYVHSTAGIVTFSFTIPSGKSASIKMWGNRDSADGQRVGQFRLKGTTTWTDVDAGQNIDYNRAFTATGTTLVEVEVQAKAGSQFAYIGVIDITLTTVVVPQRLLFDMGTIASATPAGTADGAAGVDSTTGLYWNNLGDASFGNNATNKTYFTSAKDTTNSTVAIGLSVDKWPAGSQGASAFNAGNNVGVIGDYPATATDDCWFIQAAVGIVSMTFVIPAGRTATIKLWASRSAAGPRILQARKQGETTWLESEAAFNTSYTNAIVLTGVTGTTVIEAQAKSGSPFGYVSVMDITLS